MFAMDRLIKLIPPPMHPFDAGGLAQFAAVEKMLGLTLPVDFKKLTVIYGTGVWQEFWYLLNPNTINPHLNLIVQSQSLRPNGWSTLDSERLYRSQFPDTYPHPIFPEPGGILPWAITDNGGRYYWLTGGDPDRWPTIYYADRDRDYVLYNESCAEIVRGAASGTLPILAEAFGVAFEYGRADSFIPKQF